MSGRKKHRVIVEMSFTRNVTAKHAKQLLDWKLGLSERSYLDVEKVTKITVKEAERVIQAELRWRGKVKDESVRDVT